MRVHLLSSTDPLAEKTRQVGLCGAEIVCAEFVLTWDGDLLPDIYRVLDSMRGICTKCRKHNLDGRYVYGLTERRSEQEMDAA